MLVVTACPVQAQSDGESVENALLAKINTLRALCLSDNATYVDSGYFTGPEGNFIPVSEMPSSLVLSDELSAAANSHAKDMIDRVYYDVDTPSGVTPAERAVEFGYQPVFVEEGIGAIAFFGMITPEAAAEMIFEEMSRQVADLLSENGTPCPASPMLNPYVTQLGVGLQGGTIVIDEEYYNVYVLVLDYGYPVPEGDDSSIVWGHIFNDINKNGRYDSNEGLGGVRLWLTGDMIPAFSPARVQRHTALSDGAGFYVLKIPPGDYTLSVTVGQEVIEQYPVDLFSSMVMQNDIVLTPGDQW